MGRIVNFTAKQQDQILGFFEQSHRSIVDPNNIDNSGIIALFRACRDYCNKVGGRYGFGRRTPNAEERAKYKQELLDRLDLLSIRYYAQL
ncbi:MAG: hypothetical protein LBC84_06730 [Prevotellaceae bacterium]|nr:hypothetical protein [Prevotellaceae bacterium]